MSQSAFITLPTGVLAINNTGIPPAAGTLGEQIRSFVGAGSAISLSIGQPKTITSITLTPGIWDITGITSFATTGGITATTLISGISTANNTYTGATSGDNQFYTNVFPVVGAPQPIYMPSYRVNVTVNTNYYLVASAIFSVGDVEVFGRISAVRVC